MSRLDQAWDVAVLENQTSALPFFPDGNVHDGAGQVVGPNHLVREEHPKGRVDRAQEAVTEIWCRIASRKLLPDGYRCLTGNVTDERVCHHVAFTTWEAPWIPR